MLKSIITLCIFLITFSPSIQSQSLLEKMKQKAKERLDRKTDNAMDKALDDAENGAKGSKNKPNTKEKQKETTKVVSTSSSKEVNIKAYQNYDFVPGDNIIFEDSFTDDSDGEFPAHWELVAGQGVVNKVNGGDKGFLMTEGNYGRFNPRMKKKAYLTDPYTVEYDMYSVPGSFGVVMALFSFDKALGYDKEANLTVNSHEVTFYDNLGGINLSKTIPEDIADENFYNKWHHVSIASKNKQMKVYVDQYRVLVVPDIKTDYERIQFAGVGDDKAPEIIKNFKIALGGNMNMIGKKFTDTKIVTHGITFDIDKANIKPESMGTLNMIAQVLKENPELKFEIDGHTDNTGSAAHNLTLSESRANAVKNQLESLGIDGARLTTKGFGDTKPISDNSSLEGKANNRRVEFVKK